MTEIAVTANIKDAINKALDLPTCDKSFRQVLESCSGADSITVTTLQSLSKLLRDQLHDDTHRYWLHELLKGTTLYRPPTSRPPRNPELQARLDKIAADNSNKEYAKMVKSAVVSEQDKAAFRIPHDEMQEIRGHLSAIINILFSIIACFGAFYKMSGVISGDPGVRVLLSLFGALVVGIAEVALYMSYLSAALTPPKEKKKKKKSN